jgi:SNF2 family DNA or RNA helicase
VYNVLHRYLSFRRLDLQDPPFFNPACRYNNPRFSRKNDAPPLYQQQLQQAPPSDSGTTYTDQTKQRITQLLDSIPNSAIRRRAFNAKPSPNDTTGPDIDGDSLKQYGLTVEDLHMEGLTITLLPHQVEGIRWMIDREDNEHSSGGILADVSDCHD